MLVAIATVLLTLLQTTPAGVTGRWEGSLTSQAEDGSTKTDTAVLLLEQKDTTVTGTIGGNENDQFAITAGKVEGNTLTITAQDRNGRDFRVTLTVEKDEMKGTVVSGPQTAQVQVRRRTP
jgi:hypothetical protein